MRICVVSINYEPEESGIAPYTTGMAVGLAARGHDVEVLTGLPHYPEWRVNPAYRGLSGTAKAMDGVVVRRFAHYVPANPTTRSRVIFETTFGARVASARWDKPELVLTVSPSVDRQRDGHHALEDGQHSGGPHRAGPVRKGRRRDWRHVRQAWPSRQCGLKVRSSTMRRARP